VFLNIASNGVTYIGGEIVFKNMIIHQQSIIGFNISSIEGNENLFIEYFNITKGLFLYVKDLMKIDL
jgi:hypothetical protein